MAVLKMPLLPFLNLIQMRLENAGSDYGVGVGLSLSNPMNITYWAGLGGTITALGIDDLPANFPDFPCRVYDIFSDLVFYLCRLYWGDAPYGQPTRMGGDQHPLRVVDLLILQ